MTTKISILKNGPLKVESAFTLADGTGKAFALPDGKPCFLCRCGHSGNKPFCDGSHGKAGFQSEVIAP